MLGSHVKSSIFVCSLFLPSILNRISKRTDLFSMKKSKGKGMLTECQIMERKSYFLFGVSLSPAEDEGNAGYDPISRLPDEILAMILAPLTLQEAARTSILSKRWRYVWSSSLKLDLTLRT